MGAFAPPWAVVNDELLLETLADRDWCDGFSEAVKFYEKHGFIALRDQPKRLFYPVSAISKDTDTGP